MEDLICVSSYKLFSLAQSRDCTSDLPVWDSKSSELLSLVAGHWHAGMCLHLSLPLDQAPQDQNSPFPKPGCFFCLLCRPGPTLAFQGRPFHRGEMLCWTHARSLFLSCNICHLDSQCHRMYQGRYLWWLLTRHFQKKPGSSLLRQQQQERNEPGMGAVVLFTPRSFLPPFSGLLEGCSVSLCYPLLSSPSISYAWLDFPLMILLP